MDPDEVDIKDFSSWLDDKLKLKYSSAVSGLNERFVAFFNCLHSISEDVTTLSQIIRKQFPNEERFQAMSQVLSNIVCLSYRLINDYPAILNFRYFEHFKVNTKSAINNLEICAHPLTHLSIDKAGHKLIWCITAQINYLNFLFEEVINREMIVEPILKAISDVQCVIDN